MQQPGPIAEYAETLARELDFDRALARRVRQEIEDHLWEAAEAGPESGSPKAQRQAIERFGDPRAIASQYVTASLLQQIRSSGQWVILVVAGVLAAMVARVVWFRILQVTIRLELQTAYGIFFAIDKYAFLLALAVGIAGWFYISRRTAPPSLNHAYRKQLRIALGFCAAAALAVMTSVVSDLVILGFRAASSGWSGTLVLPVLSMAVELACAAALAHRLVAHTRSSVSARALLRA